MLYLNSKHTKNGVVSSSEFQRMMQGLTESFIFVVLRTVMNPVKETNPLDEIGPTRFAVSPVRRR
jgi:hypothetical protein